MKVKDIVETKGCYSAHDVGEIEVQEASMDEVLRVMENAYLKKDNWTIDDLAKALHDSKEFVIVRRK